MALDGCQATSQQPIITTVAQLHPILLNLKSKTNIPAIPSIAMTAIMAIHITMGMEANKEGLSCNNHSIVISQEVERRCTKLLKAHHPEKVMESLDKRLFWRHWEKVHLRIWRSRNV